MIQRIQTIYWLIVTILSALACWLPIADISGDLLQCSLSAWQLTFVTSDAAETVVHLWGFFAISVTIPLVSFLSIWLYKKRMLQIRLCVVNMVLMLGYYVILGVCVWKIVSTFQTEFGLQMFGLHIAAVFPLINIILTWLAMRGVAKDEAKVRAADRLR